MPPNVDGSHTKSWLQRSVQQHRGQRPLDNFISLSGIARWHRPVASHRHRLIFAVVRRAARTMHQVVSRRNRGGWAAHRGRPDCCSRGKSAEVVNDHWLPQCRARDNSNRAVIYRSRGWRLIPTPDRAQLLSGARAGDPDKHERRKVPIIQPGTARSSAGLSRRGWHAAWSTRLMPTASRV